MPQINPSPTFLQMGLVLKFELYSDYYIINIVLLCRIFFFNTFLKNPSCSHALLKVKIHSLKKDFCQIIY